MKFEINFCDVLAGFMLDYFKPSWEARNPYFRLFILEINKITSLGGSFQYSMFAYLN